MEVTCVIFLSMVTYMSEVFLNEERGFEMGDTSTDGQLVICK
jgi:hypothetical protein